MRFVKIGFVFLGLLGIAALAFFARPLMTGNAIMDSVEPPEDMNIVFITIDTLRADHLGVYGYERDTSPNIDEFAEESLIFEKAYVQWPRTGPSMTSIFSSTYAHTNGVMRTEKISEDILMLPEVLKENGYSTFAVVNNPVLSEEFNFDQGYDEFFVIGEGEDFFGGSDAQGVTEKAIDWLDKNKEGQFFVWAHYIDPHAAYNAVIGNPEHDIFVDDKYYAKKNVNLPIGDYAMLNIIQNSANLNNVTSADYYIAQYDAEIHYSDKWVGELLDYLKENGLYENTLIIISADHGEGLGEHDYYFNHGAFTYEDSTHVPLIIHSPEVLNGRIDTAVPMIDLTPTILDVLNIPLGEDMEGHSLLPLVFENKNQNKFIFTEALELPTGKATDINDMYTISIRDEQYKLIRNSWKVEDELISVNRVFKLAIVDGSIQQVKITFPPYELYDIINDPYEENDLLKTGKLEYMKIAEKMDKEIDKWFDSAEKFKYSSEGTPELSDEKLAAIKSLGYMQ